MYRGSQNASGRHFVSPHCPMWRVTTQLGMQSGCGIANRSHGTKFRELAPMAPLFATRAPGYVRRSALPLLQAPWLSTCPPSEPSTVVLCCLPYNKLLALLKRRAKDIGCEEDQYTVLVTLEEGKSFRVYVNKSGRRNRMLGKPFVISRNKFPNQLFT